MASIDTRYSAVLPAQSTFAEDLSDITAQARAQITTKQAHASAHSLESIDWSSFNKTTSHQMITLDASTRKSSDETLDTLVNSILTHIGSPASN